MNVKKRKKCKRFNKKTMRLLSLLLAASLFLGTQGFTVFAGTVSQNGAAAPESSWTEPEGKSIGQEEEHAESNPVYPEDSDSANPQQEVLPDSNVSENNVRVGTGTPANPIHHCTKKDDDTDYTDFSYVYFGSYPQSEVTDSATIAAIDNAIATAGTTADAGVDVWVNGTKYRRINKSDTNHNGYFDEVSNNGYRYFKWERIKWKVLQNDGNTLFVVADKAIDCKDYNDEYTSITWEGSTIRNWLNNSFYSTAFSSSEQNAIITQDVVNEDNPEYGTEGGNNTSDKIYLLSIGEVTNETYGFCSDYSTYSVSRRMKTSDYANARGTGRNSSSGYGGNCWWWLRSPGSFSSGAAYVGRSGYVTRDGFSVSCSRGGVCPALHINLSSGIWSMADDGTSGEGGNGGGDESRVQIPKADIPGGTYTTSQKITLSSATEGAEIYYTTDGSTPGKENGSRYTGMIAVKDSITLKAVAVKDGMTDSDIMEESYSFSTEAPKIITVPQLSLGEEKSGSVENKDALRFFPGNFKLSPALIPVTASQSTEADGSYKLKFAIGIGRADWLDNSTKWNQYKKSVDALEKSSSQIEKMQSKYTLGGKSVSFFEAKGFKAKPEISALGYYELEIDKNGNVVKNTGMFQTDAKWKASADWQFVTPIGPMYLNLSGSGKITGKLGVSYAPGKNNLSEGTWKMEGKATLTPGISLEGGYGIAKVATIGASGSAEIPVQIYPASKGEFKATASVHVYVIFVLDTTFELPIINPPIVLWDTTKSKAASKSGASWESETNIQLNPEDLKPVDRSYAEHTTSWQGDTATGTDGRNLSAKAGAEEEMPAGWTEHILQSGIMPNSLPTVRQIGNDTVMVFQANDASRSTLDSSVLMYSVYQNGTWSEPVPVWDNGTCDMYADMQVTNGELYLLWQKENARIAENGEDGEQILARMAEKSEICFARYDKGQKKFVDMAYITSDKEADMMPKLAANGNKVTAVWITNSAGSFLQEEGMNRIVYADLENGAFSEEKVLCERETAIEELAPYYAGSTLYTTYVSNASEENDTNQVFLSSVNGADREISDGITLTSNLQWQDGTLYYYEDGTMKAYDMSTGVLSSITAGESPIGANGKIFVNGGKTAMVWSAPDQVTGSSKVYSSVKTAEGFSEPVTLYSTTSSIKYLDGTLNADGSWQFMMNTADAAASTGEPLHSLVFVTKEEKTTIEADFITVDDAAKENEATPISYMAVNTSEETITSLLLTIEGENGFYKQQSIPVSIAPGETVYDTVDVDLTKVTDTTNATITLCAPGQAAAGNNTVEAAIAQTDLTLEAAMTETEEDVCIVASVSNNSMIPADATLTLYGDVEQTRQLETVSIGEISKEAGGSYTFYLKKSSLVMNENGAAYMPIVVTSDKADSNEDNNTVIKIAYATLDDPDKEEEGGTEDDKKEEGGTEGGTTGKEDKKEDSTGKNESIKVTKLTITAPSKKLAAGKKVKLTLNVNPSNASNKTVSWNTSNKKYAAIDKNGKLTLKKAGAGRTVTITATAKDGSGTKASIKIKIMKHAVKSIKLKTPSKTLKAGKTMTVSAAVKTTGKSANKTLKWQSSNTKYATVNKKGKITAKKTGKGKTVTITAASTDGSNKKAKVKIKIQ